MLPILPMLPIMPTLLDATNADGLALCKSSVPKRCKKDAANARADGTDVDCCSFPPELVMIAHTHTHMCS